MHYRNVSQNRAANPAPLSSAITAQAHSRAGAHPEVAALRTAESGSHAARWRR